MCYTSVITPWYFFLTFYTLLIPLYTLLATTNPSFRRNVNVSGAMGESRIGWQILAVTINFIYIYAFNTVIFNFQRDVKVSIAMGENSDRMTQKKKTSHNPIPPSAPPPPEGSVTFLQYPSLVVNLYTPPLILCLYSVDHNRSPKKNIRLPQNRVKITETFYTQLS